MIDMRERQVLRHVVLTQALRVVLPPMVNYAIALLKDTSVASLTSVPELMLRASDLSSEYFMPMHELFGRRHYVSLNGISPLVPCAPARATVRTDKQQWKGGSMIDKVDVVVVGSGALGASTAFHLAKAGRSVALVDKAAIASQTSPRAAGLSGQLRWSELMTRLASRAVAKIERFTEETGEPMVFFQPGSLKIARTPEHEKQVHEEVAPGKQPGLYLHLIPPD